jgi:hypothetical protein
VVIFEVTSIWRFHDDTVIKINACSIFTLVDGQFTDQRIYVDTPRRSLPQRASAPEGAFVARILSTGSAQGLGRAAAAAATTSLLDEGHQVVVHVRDTNRPAALTDQLGRMDAVIHNAGVYGDRDRHPSPDGHPRTLAINTLAPYLLTELIHRPDRLI